MAVVGRRYTERRTIVNTHDQIKQASSFVRYLYTVIHNDP